MKKSMRREIIQNTLKELLANKFDRSLLMILFLLICLLFTMILVQQQQNLRGKAEVDFSRTFSINGDQPVTCSGADCTTESNTVHIQFNQQSAQDLLNSLP